MSEFLRSLRCPRVSPVLLSNRVITRVAALVAALNCLAWTHTCPDVTKVELMIICQALLPEFRVYNTFHQ